jgi:hypothetical protein
MSNDTISLGSFDFGSMTAVDPRPAPKPVSDPCPDIFPNDPTPQQTADIFAAAAMARQVNEVVRDAIKAPIVPLIGALDPMVTAPKETERFFADTKVLEECFHYAEHMRDMLQSDEMALKVVGVLSFGLRRSGEMLADAIYKQKMAKSARKQAEAVAALENFGRFLAQRQSEGESLKATDSIRQHYIALDEGSLKATEREAFFEAMVSQLETYKMQFTMVLSAIKAMISKQRGDQLIGGSDTQGAGDRTDQ